MLVAGGSTNVTTYFSMRLVADGTAATGLTATDFDLQYVRSGAAPSTKADATAGTAGGAAAHSDNTVVEPDATDQPGLYRIDWPDAAFTAGAREVILTVKVATAFTEHLRVEIDGEVNVVEWAGTDVVAGAIPAVAADSAGGLPISDAGGLDLDAKLANTNEITAARMGALTDWINGGRLDLILDIIAADVVNIDGAAMRGTDGANITVPDAAGTAPTAVENRAEMDSNSTRLTAIVGDTNELQGDWTNGGRLDLLLDAIKAITDALPDSGALTTIGTDTARLTAVRAAVLTDWINGGRLDLILDAIKVVTDGLNNFDPTAVQTESYAADGATGSVVQLLYMILALVSEFSISGTTITSKRLDGSTTAMTHTIDSDTNPTSRTRAT